LRWSEDIACFVESLLNHKLSYSQCAMLAPNIYFAGPKKAYALNLDEQKLLCAAGISSKFGWAYKHTIIKGFKFDIAPRKLADTLSCNCIFTTKQGGLYFLETVLLIEHKGFLICKQISKLQHMGPDFDDFVIKVGAVGKRLKAVAVENVLGFKYHVLLDSKGEISFVSKVPNTREIE